MTKQTVWLVVRDCQIGNYFEVFSSFDDAKSRLVEIGDEKEEGFTAYCMELEVDGPGKSDGAVDYTLHTILSGAHG